MERIDAALLIPGRGEPVADATVLIDGTQISYAGPAAGAPDVTRTARRRVPTVAPGLMSARLIARNPIIPAHSNGAVSSSPSESGSAYAKSSRTTAYSQ